MSESVIKIKVDGAKAEQTLNKIDSEIKSLKADQDRLSKAFSQGSISMNTYNKSVSNIDKQIAQLTKSKKNLISTLQRQGDELSGVGKKIRDMIPGIDGLEKSWDNLANTLSRKMSTAMGSAIGAVQSGLESFRNTAKKVAEETVRMFKEIEKAEEDLANSQENLYKARQELSDVLTPKVDKGAEIGKLRKEEFEAEMAKHETAVELWNQRIAVEEARSRWNKIKDSNLNTEGVLSGKTKKQIESELNEALEKEKELTDRLAGQITEYKKKIKEREAYEQKTADSEKKASDKKRRDEEKRRRKEADEYLKQVKADLKLRLEAEDAVQELKMANLGEYEKKVKKAELDRDKTIRNLEEKREKATSQQTKDALTEQIELVKRNFQEVVLPQIAISQLGTIIDKSNIWKELPIKIDPKEWEKRFKSKYTSYELDLGRDPWEELKVGTPEYRAASKEFIKARAKKFIRENKATWPDMYKKASELPESVVEELYEVFSKSLPDDFTKGFKDLYNDYKKRMVKEGKDWAIVSFDSWLSVQEKIWNKTSYAELAELRAETSIELLEEAYDNELKKLKTEVSRESESRYGIDTPGSIYRRLIGQLDLSEDYHKERMRQGSPLFTSKVAKESGQEQIDKLRATFLESVDIAEEEFEKLDKSLRDLLTADIAKFDELLEGNLISEEDYYKEITALRTQTEDELIRGQEALDEKRRALEYKYLLDVQRINIETAQKVTEAWASGISNYAGLLQETSNIFSELAETEGESQEKWLKYQRMSIYISEAAALANGVATAMKASNWVEALAAAASVTASLISTFNKVKSIESQAQSAKAARYATGGYISGPGSGTSDSIPARLSNGESVINQRATALYAPLLSAINQSTGGAPIMTQRNQNSLARELALAVSAQPAPVVAVTDINTGQNRVKYVRTLGKI